MSEEGLKKEDVASMIAEALKEALASKDNDDKKTYTEDEVKALVAEKVKQALENKDNDDPFKELRTGKKEEIKTKEEQEKLVNFYGDTKVEFEKQFGASAKDYFNRVDEMNLSLNDKINYLTKEMIRKEKGDTDETKALLESFKNQDVVDSSSAFNATYKQIVHNIKEKQTDFIVVTGNSDKMTIDELENLAIACHRGDEEAIAKVKKEKIVA